MPVSNDDDRSTKKERVNLLVSPRLKARLDGMKSEELPTLSDVIRDCIERSLATSETKGDGWASAVTELTGWLAQDSQATSYAPDEAYAKVAASLTALLESLLAAFEEGALGGLSKEEQAVAQVRGEEMGLHLAAQIVSAHLERSEWGSVRKPQPTVMTFGASASRQVLEQSRARQLQASLMLDPETLQRVRAARETEMQLLSQKRPRLSRKRSEAE